MRTISRSLITCLLTCLCFSAAPARADLPPPSHGVSPAEPAGHDRLDVLAFPGDHWWVDLVERVTSPVYDPSDSTRLLPGWFESKLYEGNETPMEGNTYIVCTHLYNQAQVGANVYYQFQFWWQRQVNGMFVTEHNWIHPAFIMVQPNL